MPLTKRHFVKAKPKRILPGSSEAAMLGGLALKRRWQQRRRCRQERR
jgi:hypothetical protein